MLISGGKVIAIDKVNHDETLSGDGVFNKLGVNKDLFSKAVYFSDSISSQYFTWNGNTLSANSAVSFFNVSYTYNVNPPQNACNDYVYSGTMAVNGITTKHYIEGYKNNESHNLSYNFLNDAPNGKYIFTSGGECPITKLKVSCIGFITNDVKPSEVINVLGTENSDIISFNGIALRI